MSLISKNLRKQVNILGRRSLKVLALESSCDDSCVAVIEKDREDGLKVIQQEKMTLNSAKWGGIIPTEAHMFHQSRIGNLVRQVCEQQGFNSANPPDLICCTRGPGMVGSLSATLQLAKGLAIAWDRPLIGVHHMLGHILISQMPKTEQPHLPPPKYPFLSLLCSGGHTLLVYLKSLSEHEIIINTSDIAVGDSIDKCAREIGLTGNLLGMELENFVHSIPQQRKEEFDRIKTVTRDNAFNFQLKLPLRGHKHMKVPDNLEFSFSSFLSAVQGYKKQLSIEIFDLRTKQFLAYKLQNLIFDHIIDRTNIALLKHGFRNDIFEYADNKFEGVNDFICSGGVASNQTLRQKMSKNLLLENLTEDKNNFHFHFPDISLCTDNAVMIGIAGLEIYEKLQLRSDMSILPLRKWTLSDLVAVDGWLSCK